MEDIICVPGGAEWRNPNGRVLRVLRGVSGITSVIASSTLIWMILRSHARLSTTQHRLLLGLSVADILFSLSSSLFGVTPPSDQNDTIHMWNETGNMNGCTLQGFLQTFGGLSGLYYRCSLNLYYLAVVKYNMSERCIRIKIEKFLHGAPIIISLAYILAGKHYSDDISALCWMLFCDPPYCEGHEDEKYPERVPIGSVRGRDGVVIIHLLQVVCIVIPPIIVGVALGMIYITVSKQEKKITRYGIGSLRVSSQQFDINVDQDKESKVGPWGRSKKTLSLLALFNNSRFATVKNSFTSSRGSCIIRNSNCSTIKSRIVLQRAIAYFTSYFLSWALHMVGLTFLLAGNNYPHSLAYFVQICMPLQGLWNFAIFIHPKAMHARRSRKKNVSCCQALKKAVLSRGCDCMKKSNDNLHDGVYKKENNSEVKKRKLKWMHSLRSEECHDLTFGRKISKVQVRRTKKV